jgi:hypothetical protein
MFEKIKTFTEYGHYMDAISFHSATDTLHDYTTLTDNETGQTTYIVVTK